jgi:hypothetical protein
VSPLLAEWMMHVTRMREQLADAQGFRRVLLEAIRKETISREWIRSTRNMLDAVLEETEP